MAYPFSDCNHACMCRRKSHEGEHAPSWSRPGEVKLGPLASSQDGSASIFEDHPHHQALTITSLLSMFMAASFMSPSAPASLLLLRGGGEGAAGGNGTEMGNKGGKRRGCGGCSM